MIINQTLIKVCLQAILMIKIDTTSYDRFKIGLSNGSIGATTKVRTYGFNI